MFGHQSRGGQRDVFTMYNSDDNNQNKNKNKNENKGVIINTEGDTYLSEGDINEAMMEELFSPVPSYKREISTIGDQEEWRRKGYGHDTPTRMNIGFNHEEENFPPLQRREEKESDESSPRVYRKRVTKPMPDRSSDEEILKFSRPERSIGDKLQNSRASPEVVTSRKKRLRSGEGTSKENPVRNYIPYSGVYVGRAKAKRELTEREWEDEKKIADEELAMKGSNARRRMIRVQRKELTSEEEADRDRSIKNLYESVDIGVRSIENVTKSSKNLKETFVRDLEVAADNIQLAIKALNKRTKHMEGARYERETI